MNMGDVPVPNFTPEQKQQIKKYADTVLTVLDEMEDKVWEIDEGQVADVMKVVGTHFPHEAFLGLRCFVCDRHPLMLVGE